MYTVVLMAALTTSGEAPEKCFHHAAYNCSKYGCGGYGCYGYGCYQSNTCSFFSCKHSWACTGATCHGSFGCSSYAGCGASSGCFGCYGSYGYSFYSGHGCYTACSGYYGCISSGCYSAAGCHGCYGCSGCAGCSGCYAGPTSSGITPYTPSQVVPSAPQMPPAAEEGKPSDSSVQAPATRARLIVKLPADANLFIDDQQMKSTSDQRTFSTPVLEPGQTYFYELKVELTRGGEKMSESRRVLIRSGEVAEASFTEESVIAAYRANTFVRK